MAFLNLSKKEKIINFEVDFYDENSAAVLIDIIKETGVIEMFQSMGMYLVKVLYNIGKSDNYLLLTSKLWGYFSNLAENIDEDGTCNLISILDEGQVIVQKSERQDEAKKSCRASIYRNKKEQLTIETYFSLGEEYC